jgi:hypothetical protein
MVVAEVSGMEGPESVRPAVRISTLRGSNPVKVAAVAVINHHFLCTSQNHWTVPVGRQAGLLGPHKAAEVVVGPAQAAALD